LFRGWLFRVHSLPLPRITYITPLSFPSFQSISISAFLPRSPHLHSPLTSHLSLTHLPLGTPSLLPPRRPTRSHLRRNPRLPRSSRPHSHSRSSSPPSSRSPPPPSPNFVVSDKPDRARHPCSANKCHGAPAAVYGRRLDIDPAADTAKSDAVVFVQVLNARDQASKRQLGDGEAESFQDDTLA
jgi:hypothetical protein